MKEFRVWDKKRKLMYRGDEVSAIHSNGILVIVYDGNDYMIMPEDYIFMLYTGKQGIKGLRIWEGDILRYSIDGHVQSSLYVINDMVEWFEEMYDADPYCRWDDVGEVVGNAHENPELLKKVD